MRSDYQIDVLGTKYTVRVVKNDEDEYMKANDIGGYCDEFLKEIRILDLKSTTEFDRRPDKIVLEAMKQTLRHEIVHAFLNESGLSVNSDVPDSGWARHEEMVDWFAVQGPKIHVAWITADAL